MNEINCWDYMNCGNGPEGFNSTKSGACPVAKDNKADGLNNGINGGRLCWVIAENSPLDAIKCSELHLKSSCFSCEFKYKVTAHEGLLNICNATGVYITSTTHNNQPAPEYQESLELLRSDSNRSG